MYIKCFIFLYFVGFIEASYRTSETCGFPRLVNGRVRTRQKSRLVKFICFPGYELVGNKYATCMGTEWDVPLPICVRSGCTVPQIENGVHVPSREDAWVVYFCLPGYKMIGPSTIYCNGKNWNGTAPSCVDSTSKPSLKCDFEEPNLCGWRQDDLHDFDWTRLNTKTPSSFLFTGPSYDHTYGIGESGYFMYIESTSRVQDDAARLISPIYDGTLAKDGCFVFFYHMYGHTTGGLRVYQKPENYGMDALLRLRSGEKQKYILFEKWGNQWNVWHEAVLQLIDFSDNFQIVIEGIRGSSITSDIAIDDVGILQGSNCSAAKREATTSSGYTADSCVSRCALLGQHEVAQSCSCKISCLNNSNCCFDFFDICMFSSFYETSNDDGLVNSTEVAPQTQKLIATTPETTSTTIITETPTRSETTTTKITTTTTTSTITTTARPTITLLSTTTTTTTTTAKPKTRLTTTTRMTTKNTSNTTLLNDFFTNTQPLRTEKSVVTRTKTTPFTADKTSKASIDYSRPIEDHEVYQDMLEKAKKEHDAELRQGNKVPPLEEAKRKSNGLKITFIILLSIVCCAGFVWLVVEVRSTRGRLMLARFRGQISRDPEVRYLSTDVDDD